jgi:hypothetical protein
VRVAGKVTYIIYINIVVLNNNNYKIIKGILSWSWSLLVTRHPFTAPHSSTAPHKAPQHLFSRPRHQRIFQSLPHSTIGPKRRYHTAQTAASNADSPAHYCCLLQIDMNRVFGRKKAPGPPPPSLGEASAGVGNHIEGMDGKFNR